MNSNDLAEIVRIVGVPIKASSAGIISKIENAPHAQFRTAPRKKAVYIVGDLVYKGPYKDDDSMLIKNLIFTYAVQLLEEALKIPEWQQGALPWEYLLKLGSDQYYLVAPNVGKAKNIPFDLISSKIETDVVPVVPRGGAVLRVSDAEKNGQLTDDIKLAALQHLYFRFLFNIGDSGTHNILIREDHNKAGRLIAGIDLEERRGDVAKKRRLDHLFKSPKGPSKKQEQLYKPYVDRVVPLTDDQLNQHTSDKLSTVGIDLEKLRMNMETWKSLD